MNASFYHRIGVVVLLTTLVLTSIGCAVSRNPLSGRKRAYAYSWQQELQLGRESDPQIVAQYGEYPDDRLAAYVDSLGQVLLGHSHLRRADADPEFRATPFTFRVLDSPVVNAFALPGGYVYVTRGMLAHLENEAQLAVVLGHEIGHVAGRHGSKRATTQLIGQAVLLGSAVGGGMVFGEDVASSILQLGGTAAQLFFLKYGRDDERESDQVGVEYAARAGYAASEGAQVFRTLARLGEMAGQSLPSFLSTHPDPGEREQAIAQMAAEWAARTPSDRVGRARMLSALDGMVAGENPRNGLVRSGTFHHPDLGLQFPVPTGFQVVNQASRVVLVGPEQRAAVMFEMDQAASARDAAEAFSATSGLTVVQSGLGSSNGLTARFVVAEATDANGAVMRMRAHFVEFGGRVFRFTGWSAASEFASWDPSFTAAMQGFGPLRDASIAALQPMRIRLVQNSRSGPFRSFVATENMGGFDAETLAILNQVGVDDVVQAGRVVKLVR